MDTNDARTLLSNLLGTIAPEIDLSDAARDARLQDDFDLDSMDFLTLVTSLYDATGVDVPEREYSRLATIGGFTDYVVAHTS